MLDKNFMKVQINMLRTDWNDFKRLAKKKGFSSGAEMLRVFVKNNLDCDSDDK